MNSIGDLVCFNRTTDCAESLQWGEIVDYDDEWVEVKYVVGDRNFTKTMPWTSISGVMNSKNMVLKRDQEVQTDSQTENTSGSFLDCFSYKFLLFGLFCFIIYLYFRVRFLYFLLYFILGSKINCLMFCLDNSKSNIT